MWYRAPAFDAMSSTCALHVMFCFRRVVLRLASLFLPNEPIFDKRVQATLPLSRLRERGPGGEGPIVQLHLPFTLSLRLVGLETRRRRRLFVFAKRTAGVKTRGSAAGVGRGNGGTQGSCTTSPCTASAGERIIGFCASGITFHALRFPHRAGRD